ncbi:MAG: CotH kinase family protein [Bacteroidales bacterium]|nr:CotH kinase family protein [Bacteroidales bacterium]
MDIRSIPIIDKSQDPAAPGQSSDPVPVTPPDDVAKGNAFVFDDTALPKMTISVSLEQWNALLEAYDKDSNTRDYIHCDVLFIKDNKRYTVSDAGLRLRGQTSRRRPEGSGGEKHKAGGTDWHHCHFGLNFRHFHKKDKDYDLRGVHRINLKYAKEDPTYIREKYCFDLLKRFGVWTAGEASWCRLYVSVEGDPSPAYYGVYLMMEAIDDEFVEERKQFAADTGFLWKGAWGANLRDTDDWRFGVDDNSGKQYAYELKTGKDEFAAAKQQLKGFINNVRNLSGDAFKSWISEHCDVDLLLRTYAAFIALGHWDDYWNDMNNFYLYFDSTDKDRYKVYMLPYDMDNTLGTSHNCGVQNDSGRQNPYRWGLDECIFISKLLTLSEYKNKYTSYLKTLAAEGSPFVYEESIKRISAWQEMIKPYLANDTGEDEQIKDRPASWSNHREYRVMEDGSNNWFRVKCKVLNSL